jgi:hypothetical protein
LRPRRSLYEFNIQYVFLLLLIIKNSSIIKQILFPVENTTQQSSVNKQDKNSKLSHLVSVSQKSKPHRWCNGWRVRTSSVADRGFDPMLGQTKDYDIGICCFSAKHTALRSKNKDWMARNQDNVSEWSDMSTRELFQWASSIKIQLSVLVWNKADFIIISLKINLFTPWYSWTITHSLTHSQEVLWSVNNLICLYLFQNVINIYQ